jgi:N-acetylmuramoyl-L-alanine amidase
MNQTIVIDPGHGGQVPCGSSSPLGVRGPGGVLEKTVALALAQRVAAKLGPGAILTRTGDTNLSLADRARVAVRYGAPVFLSLHANAGPPGQRGAETFVHARATRPSLALAQAVQRELAAFGGPVPGTVAEGELAVLTPERLGAHTAACLVEVDYLSDAAGERRLTDGARLDALGSAVARGVTRYFGGAAAAYAEEAAVQAQEMAQLPDGAQKQSLGPDRISTGSSPTTGSTSLRGPVVYFGFQSVGSPGDGVVVSIDLIDSAGNGLVASYSMQPITDYEWHYVRFYPLPPQPSNDRRTVINYSITATSFSGASIELYGAVFN